jgi:muconolactone delta-isomerase
MLFEVITSGVPIGITGEEFIKRLPDGMAYMKELRRKGVILHSWIRVGRSGATTIFSVDSHEELQNLLYGNPLTPHVQFEIIPLMESDGYDDVQ